MPVTIDYIATRLVPSVRAYFPEGVVSIDTATDSWALTVEGQTVILFTRENLDDGHWHSPNARLEEIKAYWDGLHLLGLSGNNAVLWRKRHKTNRVFCPAAS